MEKSLKTLGELNRLNQLTPARIGLERAGSSIATRHILRQPPNWAVRIRP